MADLKTNYVDDVLDASVNEKRKYNMIQNADGTVSFVDVTTYTQNGDSFGAKDINDTNAAVNELNSNLSDSGWVEATKDKVYVRKIGKIVWLHLEPKEYSVTTNWNVFYTIQYGYRPSEKTLYGIAWVNSDVKVMFAIGPSGEISLQTTHAGTYQIGFDCMYFTN